MVEAAPRIVAALNAVSASSSPSTINIPSQSTLPSLPLSSLCTAYGFDVKSVNDTTSIAPSHTLIRFKTNDTPTSEPSAMAMTVAVVACQMEKRKVDLYEFDALLTHFGHVRQSLIAASSCTSLAPYIPLVTPHRPVLPDGNSRPSTHHHNAGLLHYIHVMDDGTRWTLMHFINDPLFTLSLPDMSDTKVVSKDTPTAVISKKGAKPAKRAAAPPVVDMVIQPEAIRTAIERQTQIVARVAGDMYRATIGVPVIPIRPWRYLGLFAVYPCCIFHDDIYL
jgi:hypothetical protein